jgi:hypothetical protein
MSTKRNMTGEFAQFLFLDFKAVNNFKKISETVRVLGPYIVPFNILHIVHCKISPCIRNRFRTDPNRYSVTARYTRNGVLQLSNSKHHSALEVVLTVHRR